MLFGISFIIVFTLFIIYCIYIYWNFFNNYKNDISTLNLTNEEFDNKFHITDVDKDFNKDLFITKATNAFIMLHTCYALNDLSRVDHYISDTVLKEYQRDIDNNKKRNEREVYQDLKVINTNITDVSFKNDKIYIKIIIKASFYHYFINSTTKEAVSWKSKTPSTAICECIYVKKINTKEHKIVNTCPNCGMHMDINYNGKCSYCSSIYDSENYDFILDSIKSHKNFLF